MTGPITPQEHSAASRGRTDALAEVHKPVDPSQELSSAELAVLDAVAPMDPNAPSTKVTRIAKREVGYRESGTNHTKYGRWYGADGQEWCDIFVSWVFHEVGQLRLSAASRSTSPTTSSGSGNTTGFTAAGPPVAGRAKAA